MTSAALQARSECVRWMPLEYWAEAMTRSSGQLTKSLGESAQASGQLERVLATLADCGELLGAVGDALTALERKPAARWALVSLSTARLMLEEAKWALGEALPRCGRAGDNGGLPAMPGVPLVPEFARARREFVRELARAVDSAGWHTRDAAEADRHLRDVVAAVGHAVLSVGCVMSAVDAAIAEPRQEEELVTLAAVRDSIMCVGGMLRYFVAVVEAGALPSAPEPGDDLVAVMREGLRAVHGRLTAELVQSGSALESSDRMSSAETAEYLGRALRAVEAVLRALMGSGHQRFDGAGLQRMEQVRAAVDGAGLSLSQAQSWRAWGHRPTLNVGGERVGPRNVEGRTAVAWLSARLTDGWARAFGAAVSELPAKPLSAVLAELWWVVEALALALGVEMGRDDGPRDEQARDEVTALINEQLVPAVTLLRLQAGSPVARRRWRVWGQLVVWLR